MKKVSIQGQKSSYHDAAQNKYFGNGYELVCRDNFRAVFNDVSKGTSEYGVVAIENSLYGSINEVYDQLLNNHEWISGEIYLRIHHALIGLPETKLSNIKEVFSQREALAQCIVWLDKNLPNVDVHELQDTAYSVSKIAEWNDPTKVAIASTGAAEYHNLKVLESCIETNKKNYTRFIVLTKDRVDDINANKTSIILTTDHTSGALYEALGIFANHSLNLSKIESRPIPGTNWEYMFYLDFEAGINDERVKMVFAELKKLDNKITLLGSYVAGDMLKSDK